MQLMEKTKLSLVLGGKNLGKSFLKGEAISRCKKRKDNRIHFVSVNMRDGDMVGKTLMAALDLQQKKSLKWATRTVQGFHAVIKQIVNKAMSARFEGAGESAKDVLDVVLQGQQKNIETFIDKTIRSGRIPSLVVDEANLGLPGLSGDKNAAAKSALAVITKWTKETKQASVVLISSEFGYPFRLQASGFDLRDIGQVIVIGEVPKSDMLKMLKDDWSMDEDLAEMFYNYFGGDIYTTKMALDSLIRKGADFNPFAVVRCPGLPSCVKNAAARAHLENIAKQGISLIEDVETDEGARMIAEKNVGGVIDEDAITFGVPTIFTGTDNKWAVIPSSYHMKLLIAHELQQIPLPTSGRCFTNWLFVFLFCFASAVRCSKQEGGWRLFIYTALYIYIYIDYIIYMYLLTITNLIDKTNTSIHTSSLQGGAGTAPPAVWVRQIRKDREVHSMTV